MQEKETNQVENQNGNEVALNKQDNSVTAQPVHNTNLELNPSESTNAPSIGENVSDKKPKGKKLSWKKRIVIIVLALVLIVSGITVALNFDNISLLYYKIIDEKDYPRMNFENEQDMINYLKGTWKLSSRYVDNTWEEGFYCDGSDISDKCVFVFTDDAYYECNIYEINTLMRADKEYFNGKDYFNKFPEFDDFLKSAYHKRSYSRLLDSPTSGVLQDGNLKDGDYILTKVSDDTTFPPKELEKHYNQVKENVLGVSEDIITQALRNKSYSTGI